MSNYVVHRQIASGKIALNVAERIGDIRIFDRQNLGALSCDHALWNNLLWYLRRWLAVHQAIEQRCRLVSHTFQIMSNTRQWHLHAIANHRVIVYPENRNLIRDSDLGLDAGINYIGCNTVVVTENTERITQGSNGANHPLTAQRSIYLRPMPSVYRNQSNTIEASGADGDNKSLKAFLVNRIIPEWRPNEVLEVSFEQMLGP